MDQDATWQEVGLDAGHIVLDGDPALPPSQYQYLNLFSAPDFIVRQSEARLSRKMLIVHVMTEVVCLYLFICSDGTSNTELYCTVAARAVTHSRFVDL